ncbi:hypothetical protein L209DRAFT_751547 [Thermothelomyces heterothallicus CBS 203.75]
MSPFEICLVSPSPPPPTALSRPNSPSEAAVARHLSDLSGGPAAAAAAAAAIPLITEGSRVQTLCYHSQLVTITALDRPR